MYRFQNRILAGILIATAAGATAGSATGTAAQAGWTYFANRSDIRAMHENGDTLWVATNGGVLLLSVASGEVVGSLDAAGGLPSNSARTLLADGRSVYVGTDGGLAACRPAGAGLSCDPLGSYADIRNLSVGRSGALYVCTFGAGVAEVRGNRTAWVTRADSLLDDKVYAVQEGAEGEVFYATSMGLCAKTPTEWVSFQAGAGLPRGEIRDLIDAAPRRSSPERFGRSFYALVSGRGIYQFDGRRARGILRRGIFREDDVAAMDMAEDGTLWAAGRHGGLARYRDGAWNPVGDGDEEITAARWRCVHAGRSGRVYFGSADGILAAVAGEDVRKVGVSSAIPRGRIGPMVEDAAGRIYAACGPYLISRKGDTGAFGIEKNMGSVLAIAISPDSALWVAGRWGLYQRHSSGWLEVTPDVDPEPPLFRSLAFDASGGLWGGGESGDIYRFDGEIWIRMTKSGEIGPVDRIVVDRRGLVWALSDSALYSFDGRQWDRFESAELDSTGVIELAADRSGMPIFLTRNALWRLHEDGEWRRSSGPPPSQVGGYRTVAFDADGGTVLGTDRGIVRMGRGGFRLLGPSDGLRGRGVTSILADRNGRLWVGFQDDGISMILLDHVW